jgi:hypothetical protein
MASTHRVAAAAAAMWSERCAGVSQDCRWLSGVCMATEQLQHLSSRQQACQHSIPPLLQSHSEACLVTRVCNRVRHLHTFQIKDHLTPDVAGNSSWSSCDVCIEDASGCCLDAACDSAAPILAQCGRDCIVWAIHSLCHLSQMVTNG